MSGDADDQRAVFAFLADPKTHGVADVRRMSALLTADLAQAIARIGRDGSGTPALQPIAGAASRVVRDPGAGS